MLKEFEPIQKLFKRDKVCIDNKIFKLHCKATLILLAAFSLLLTFKQYVGDPIHCVVDHIPKDVMDAYCWIHSTFTVPGWVNGRIGTDVAQPGVASHTDLDEIKYHKYYQWVCFVLYFQAILFYIPRYLWKTWEGGLIKELLQSLNNPVLDEEAKTKQKKVLVDYLFKSLHRHNSYAFRFIFCEALNFVNVFGQIYLMDAFLDGGNICRSPTPVPQAMLLSFKGTIPVCRGGRSQLAPASWRISGESGGAWRDTTLISTLNLQPEGRRTAPNLAPRCSNTILKYN